MLIIEAPGQRRVCSAEVGGGGVGGVDRCVQGEGGEREGEEEGLENNSLLSAGVLGKEQVRRYPLQCFYSVYLTPVHTGEVKRRKRRR